MPYKIAQHIIDHVDGQTVLHAVSVVSRRWRAISEDERVWRALCARANIREYATSSVN
jgi:hypothetical protein